MFELKKSKNLKRPEIFKVSESLRSLKFEALKISSSQILIH